MPRESELVGCRTLLRKELDNPGHSAPDPLASSRGLSSERPSPCFVLLRIDASAGNIPTTIQTVCAQLVSAEGPRGSSEGTHDPCGVSLSFARLRVFAIFSPSICIKAAQQSSSYRSTLTFLTIPAHSEKRPLRSTQRKIWGLKFPTSIDRS